MLRRITATAGLFLFLAVVLGFGITRSGIAELFSDPVSGIRAQDETEYANSALRMASSGGWMTPRFLGRYLLVKPPLTVWLSALSMKLWHPSLLAFRLPSLLAGALATLLLIFWPAPRSSFPAAVTGLLLLSDPLWHALSRLTYTDMILACCITIAMSAAVRDPWFERRQTILVFAISSALGIMAKNVAGLLPAVILGLSFLVIRRRIPSGFVKAIALVALLAAPWHIYQLAVHPRWFWTDYVEVQLLGFGLHPPAQPVPESALHFYGKRLLWTDPPLCLLALIAIPFLLRAARERKTESVFVLCWLLVASAALLAFQYHNLPYLLLAIPPFTLTAANYGPLSQGNGGKVLAMALAGLFCIRVASVAQPWRLSYGLDAPIPAARSMEWYASQGRSNELIAVDPDDEFYSAVLPLPKVRYCFLDPTGVVFRYAPHYGYLGITVTTGQFNHLDQFEPRFRHNLREWGLDSSEPVATAIVAASPSDALSMITAHPRSDFYLPASMRGAVEEGFTKTHQVVPLPAGRFFALALDSSQATPSRFLLEPAR